LPEDIARYRHRYQRDWAMVRAERWTRIQQLGLVRGRLSEVEREVGPPYDFPAAMQALGPGEVNRPLAWSDLTEMQKEFQATKMAIHAAMIDCMDREIGRVLDQLREVGVLDDTLILFLSDNGASAEIMVRNDGHDPAADPGSAGTHLCLGPGWSTVANTPMRRHKTWVHEGGIATPLIVHWPRGVEAGGQLRHQPGHVIDIVPTILEVAGGEPLGSRAERPAPPGRSLVPVFFTDNSLDRDYLWWCHEGNRAVRVGDWKLVAAAEQAWELYNLGTDRTETRDLAGEYPEKAREMEELWTQKLTEFRELATRDLPP
jgi:arylsulfatase